MNAFVNGNTLKFVPLNRGRITSLWRDLNTLSSDQPWPAWGEDNYLQELPRKWDFSFTVHDGDVLLGYCLCSVRGGFLWVHRLVVGADARGRGVGALVLKEVESAAKRADLLGVALKTPMSNIGSVTFYQKAGFREVSRTEGYYTLMSTPKGRVSVGIHQPNYLPWLGYFYKMSLSDIFIFLDDVEFPKGSYVNRNRICVGGEAKWLTVPTGRSFRTCIADSFPSESDWVQKHLRTIEAGYKKSPYYSLYYHRIAELLDVVKSQNFADMNSALIQRVAAWIGIDCMYLRSSEMRSEGKSDERLVSLVGAVGGSVYLSGSGGANYQSETAFQEAGIQLSYANFQIQPYPQFSDEFIPGLGVLDALFHIGAEGISLMFEQISAHRAA